MHCALVSTGNFKTDERGRTKGNGPRGEKTTAVTGRRLRWRRVGHSQCDTATLLGRDLSRAFNRNNAYTRLYIFYEFSFTDLLREKTRDTVSPATAESSYIHITRGPITVLRTFIVVARTLYTSLVRIRSVDASVSRVPDLAR